MKRTYTITGMTCDACVASVHEKLSEIKGVKNVEVNLKRRQAEISMEKHISLNVLKTALPGKYSISEMGNHTSEMEAVGNDSRLHGNEDIKIEGKSKLQQLRPLLLIFLYVFVAAFLLNYKDWNLNSAMLDFMGLFYIVFSFFKFLDLKGFPESFRMYDPLAKVLPAYGWVYPFLELALGLMFLMRLQIVAALVATIVILGITTFGVTKTLLDKKSIRCACVGTALKLPMTEATFIENAIMLIMATTMLVQLI